MQSARCNCFCGDAEAKAWPALHLSLTFSKLLSANPAYHIAATMQIFSSFFCDAFAKVQLILRCCGCGVVGVASMRSWRRGAECSTLFGVAGFAHLIMFALLFGRLHLKS
ncbi:MAG: hypothetical protein WA977_08735 [Halobacteriota archaeon]